MYTSPKYLHIFKPYTEKCIRENCGRENDNLKICDTIYRYRYRYVYVQYGMHIHIYERTAHFLYFCSFCLFPFCRLVKIVFVLLCTNIYINDDLYTFIYTMKTVCLRRYRLCEKLLNCWQSAEVTSNHSSSINKHIEKHSQNKAK